MKALWHPIDTVAEWVQHGVDTKIQQRVAVMAIMISIPLIIAGPWTAKTPVDLLIYEMSAVAITLTGITWLSGLQATRAAEESAAAAQEIPPLVP